MAQVNPCDSKTRFHIPDAAGNPIFGVRLIGEGTSTRFPVIFMEVSGTTYYYWPNSSGALRYGTTEPTTSTQGSAGAAV